MKAFLATVLSVIAIGVMLIAYGLLAPRAAAMVDPLASVRPSPASARIGYVDNLTADPYGGTVLRPIGYAVNDPRAVPVSQTFVAPAPRPVASAPARRTTARVEKSRGRDWQKTALVIGGSSAAGAGLGAIFGGKKGALIGAALGGGAATLFEVGKR
jgi:hypothetical protein